MNCRNCKHLEFKHGPFEFEPHWFCDKTNTSWVGCEPDVGKCEDFIDAVTGRKPLEKDLETRCILEARKRGWDAWKNENNGNKGIPDHSLLSRYGKFLMVEFKRDAKARIRPEQIIWKERHPDTVHFIHDLDTFLKLIEE